MKLFIAALLLACAPLAAQAEENFTFVSTPKPIDGVRVPATGPAFQGGQVFGFSSDTSFADGHKETTTGKCAVWTNPPGSMFAQSGVCDAKDVYSLQFSCEAVAGSNELNCWGELHGTGGRYKGKTGLIAYRANGPSVGVGRWN